MASPGNDGAAKLAAVRDVQEGMEMADGKPPSRRVDGKPETAADKRFFDLRESGYTGPIDQDGRKATNGRAVEILRAMRGK